MPKRPLLLSLITLLCACGRDPSPEDQVREAIDSLEVAAEARDVGDVMSLVAQDFRDPYGQGPDDLRRYLHGYFIANQSIHLLTRIDSIELLSAEEARVQVTVGMVGREADAAAAWNLAADVYDFEVAMRKDGDDWKVAYAEWKRD